VISDSLGKILLLVGFFVLYVLVVSMLVSILWNYAMVKIFNLPTIDYVEALCLILLSRVFFDRPNFSEKK
jgi:hypothetical protein